MLVKWPGKTQPGSVCRDPVVIEDYFPTILEMAGASGKTLQQVDGVSFVPLLKQTGHTPADRAFVWHFPHTYGQTPYSAIRIGPWKLIYHHIGRRYELFNLDEDISEKHNLAAEKPDVVQQLANRLGQYLRQVKVQMPIEKKSGQSVSLPGNSAGKCLMGD